jgi:hypothetical protein
MSRSSFRTAVLVLLINVMVAAALELSLHTRVGERFLPPAQDSGIQYSRETHHDYVPNTRFVRSAQPGDPYGPVVIEINDAAMRGPATPPKSGFRVLVVGDSTIQASNIPWEATAWQRLSRQFAGRADFLAHGIASWAPTVEFAWISRRGVGLAPDDVILSLDGNDFFPARVFGWADEAYRVTADYEQGMPVGFRVPVRGWRTEAHDALRWFQLFRLAEGAWQRLGEGGSADWQSRMEDQIELLDQPEETWPAETAANVTQTLDVVRAVAAFLKTRHISLRVMFVPSPYAWPDEAVSTRPARWPAGKTFRYMGLQRLLRARLASDGVEWLDLQSGFDAAKASAPDVKLYFPVDGHWNTEGHAVAARILAEYYGPRLSGLPPISGRR